MTYADLSLDEADFLATLSDHDDLVASFFTNKSSPTTADIDLNSLFGSDSDYDSPIFQVPIPVPDPHADYDPSNGCNDDNEFDRIAQQSCSVINLPDDIELPPSSIKKMPRVKRRRIDTSDIAYSGRHLTPSEAARAPPPTRLETRRGNKKIIHDHLVEGVTGRWSEKKDCDVWYARGPNLQGRQV